MNGMKFFFWGVAQLLIFLDIGRVDDAYTYIVDWTDYEVW